MSTATTGRAREYKVREDMKGHGWRQIMRSAGSKGSADLYMVHLIHGGALVQVGSPSKTLMPADRVRFVTDAADTGNLAILAIVAPRVPIHYWQVTTAAPRGWLVWNPETGAR
jgi:hypothetical protein